MGARSRDFHRSALRASRLALPLVGAAGGVCGALENHHPPLTLPTHRAGHLLSAGVVRSDQVICSPPSTGSVTPVIRVRGRGRGRVGLTRVRAGARDRARGLTRVRVRAARLL